MHPSAGILVMIPFDIKIGFAIGRLISAFYEMCDRIVPSSRQIHFSFVRIGESRSSALPSSFMNLLEFNPHSPNARDVDRLCAYVRQHRIEAVFVLDLPVGTRYLADLRRAGVWKVISYWGAPMSSLNYGLKLWLKRIEVAVLHRARPDHFIFESQAMQKLGVYGRGLPLRDTSVVHTGVDLSKFRRVVGANELVRERFNISDGQKIVVYMGHLHRRKGVHVMMDAMGILVQQGRADIHCLFLGNRAGEEAEFREHFEAAQPFITFGGYQVDIPELLSGCYVGCIPSTGWDSFPMSSLEMQACGLPVIVSDCQGVPETIVDTQTGVVVPVSDTPALARAIAKMVDAPEIRRQMAEAARLRIEAQFSREHQVENLVAKVSQILKD